MTDLDTRLHDIERISPPELWADIALRQPGLPPRTPRRGLALVVAVLVASAGLYLPLRLLTNDAGLTPVDVPPGHRTITVDMPSAAMEPTIHLGETVIVDIDAYQGGSAPSRTDVIAFRDGDFPDRTFLKRVIGLPGERIRERGGVVFIDDVALEEPYLPAGQEDPTTGVWQVPTGSVFVMGDNRPNSNDSRTELGPIPIGQIIGKVIRPGGTSPPNPRQHPGTNLAGLFVPATTREGDVGIMHVTFTDGSSAELVYPASLDLAALGVTPSVSIASRGGDIGFPVEFLPRAQPGAPVDTPTQTASGVPVFPGRTRSNGFPWHQHFTYVLEHWNVNVEFPVGITADEALQSLDLHEATNGFPVIDLRAPLMFGDGSSGQPRLIVGDAYPGDKRIDLFLAPFGCSSNSMTETGLEAFLCFAGGTTNLHVEVLGGPGFAEAIFDGLGAREIRQAR